MQKLSTLHFNPSGCASARFWKLISLIHGFSFSRNKFTRSQNHSVRGGDDLFCLTATRGTNDSIKMEFLSVSFHIFNLVLRSSCVCLVDVEQVTLCSNTVRTYRLALVVDVEGVGEEIKTLPINARSEKKQMFGVFFFKICSQIFNSQNKCVSVYYFILVLKAIKGLWSSRPVSLKNAP